MRSCFEEDLCGTSFSLFATVGQLDEKLFRSRLPTDRGRQRDRQRQTEGQRDRETDRQIDRGPFRETERQTD